MTSKKKPQKDKENNGGTTVVIAILGLIGTIITAYFGFRASSRPNEIVIQATQTAEAKPIPTSTATTPSVSPTPTQEPLELLDIQFDYSDSPANHGWKFVEGNEAGIAFSTVQDAAAGSALSVSAPSGNFYAFDYTLPPNASEYATLLDFTVRYRDDRASLYVYLRMTRGGDAQNGWLRIKIGRGMAQPASSGEKEWLLFATPDEFLNDNWVRLRIDLENAVRETYGRDGWVFDKLLTLRLRGNLDIDCITAYMGSTK